MARWSKQSVAMGVFATAASALGLACSTTDAATVPDEAPITEKRTDGTPTDPTAAAAASTPGARPSAPSTPSTGCGKGGSTGERHGVSIDVRGRSRSFDIFAPSEGAAAHPLVFVFHGGGGSAEGGRSMLDFPRVAAGKAIFVYPNGEGGNWDLDSGAADNEDVAFFDAMVASIEQSNCVDRARVFATGASMGGYFANQLGCKRGDVLRAIAPHAGGGPFGGDDEYDDDGNLKCSGKAVAAMVFHGSDDDDVSVNEGEASRDFWRSANACSNKSSKIASNPCVSYEGCKNPVIWCRIAGLGHEVWENATTATWDFFAGF